MLERENEFIYGPTRTWDETSLKHEVFVAANCDATANEKK